MTDYDKINAPDGFRYIDPNELIDYLFMGFDKPLTIKERLLLIHEHGAPRTTPKDSTYEKDGIKITFENASSRFETQVIVQPNAQG